MSIDYSEEDCLLHIETGDGTHVWTKPADTDVLSVFLTVGNEDKDFSVLLSSKEAAELGDFLGLCGEFVRSVIEDDNEQQ